MTGFVAQKRKFFNTGNMHTTDQAPGDGMAYAF
jgi:hypothetical protein